MAVNVGTINVVIRALDQASDVMRRIGVNTDRQMRQVQQSSNAATASLNMLKTAAAGVLAIASTRAAWGWLIQSNAAMEQAEVGFTTMLKSAEKAKAFLGELQQFAATTPFEFTELRTAASRMMAFGFSAQEVLPTLKSIGDATSALGLGAEGVQRVIRALGQMRAKAKVSAEEMLQLTEAGIPAWELLSKGLGKSTAETMKLSQKGLIPAEKAIRALVEGMEKKFPGMMAAQSKTMAGMTSNIRDFVEMAGRTLGKGLFEQIKPAIEKAMLLVQNLTKTGQLEAWGKRIGQIAEAIGRGLWFIIKHGRELTAVLIGLTTAFVALRAAMAITAIIAAVTRAFVVLREALLVYRATANAATTATWLLGSAMRATPIGAIVTLLGVAAGALFMFRTSTQETTTALERLQKATQQEVIAKEVQITKTEAQINQLGQLKDEYIRLSQVVDNSKAKDTELTVAKGQLNKIIAQLLPIIGEEGVAHIQNAKVKEAVFNAEIDAQNKKLQAERDAVKEAKQLQIDQTRKLIEETKKRIATMKTETEAHGIIARAQVKTLEIRRDAMVSLIQAGKEWRAKHPEYSKESLKYEKENVAIWWELDTAIRNVTRSSKAKELQELEDKLAGLMGQLAGAALPAEEYKLPPIDMGNIDAATNAAKQENKALDAAIAKIEHKTRLGQLTIDQQIQAWEGLKRLHKTTQELWNIEERVYDLRKQQADESKQQAEERTTQLQQWQSEVDALGLVIAKVGAKGTAELSELSDPINDAIIMLGKFADAGDPIAKELIAKYKSVLAMVPAIIADESGKAAEEAVGIFKKMSYKITEITKVAPIGYYKNWREALRGILANAADFKTNMAKYLADAGKIYKTMTDALSKAQQEYNESVTKVETKRAEDIRKLNTDYEQDVKGVNDALADSLRKLREDYQKTFEDTSKRLKTWVGLFEEVPKLVKASVIKMITALRDQVDRFDLFYQMLANLTKRGIDEGLIAELREMGPKAAEQVLALYQATDEQLTEYVRLWKVRSELAKNEATGQLADAKEEMLAKEKEIVFDAGQELERLRQTWEDALAKVNSEAETELATLLAQWKEQTVAIRETAHTEFAQLAESAMQYGQNFVDQLMAGIKSRNPELMAFMKNTSQEAVTSWNLPMIGGLTHIEPLPVTKTPSTAPVISPTIPIPTGAIPIETWPSTAPATQPPASTSWNLPSIVPTYTALTPGELAAAYPESQIAKDLLAWSGGLVPFQEGGIVTKPTLGIVGESGPEAVVPLKQYQDIDADKLAGIIQQSMNSAANKIVAAIKEKGSVKIEKVQAAEHVHIEDQVDLTSISKQLAREVRWLTGVAGGY